MMGEMVPFIANYAALEIGRGDFLNPGRNSMLIQIGDPCCTFPVPPPEFYFREIYKFEFVDDVDPENEFIITDEQAEQIYECLRRALDQSMNVIVHCFAGIGRSGAVVECGRRMGFNDKGGYRDPNKRVYSKLVKLAGFC